MITIAVLGSIESLLCARVADTMTDDRHDPNQELMGQGVANMIVPFFGGIPATGTIARTVTNIKSGAFSPVAGMVHAITLLVVILAAAPLASNIPLCALAAILVFVAWNMGNWREFLRLRSMTLSDKATLLIPFFLTVIFDLTVAVQFGLVVACVFFLMRMNNLTVVEPVTLPFNVPDTVEAWHIKGALFFGSVSNDVVAHSHRPILLIRERMPTSESLKRIAICLDESDQSLRVQGFFTEHVDLFEQGTSFTLIHVQKSAEDEQANGFAETGTIANEVESILTRAGMNVSTKTLYGDVGDVIAEHAEEENYDMIVMGSHGYSSVSATLLGSVTMTVASECDVPLLIVR